MTEFETSDSAGGHELLRLREENARLKALLTEHGIRWEEEPPLVKEAPPNSREIPSPQLSTSEKVALFRRLFRGRSDVYPVRWESAKGKSGYSPACGNEWRRGVCQKPRIKCGVCTQRLLLSVTDRVIYDHLAGLHTVGVYPLFSDGTCYFLAADFDEADWRDDARAFMQSCRESGIPAALEVSRSGKGAHVWIFFAEAVSAREARQLGAALISQTCVRTRGGPRGTPLRFLDYRLSYLSAILFYQFPPALDRFTWCRWTQPRPAVHSCRC